MRRAPSTRSWNLSTIYRKPVNLAIVSIIRNNRHKCRGTRGCISLWSLAARLVFSRQDVRRWSSKQAHKTWLKSLIIEITKGKIGSRIRVRDSRTSARSCKLSEAVAGTGEGTMLTLKLQNAVNDSRAIVDCEKG